jgi:hypothetical protein
MSKTTWQVYEAVGGELVPGGPFPSRDAAEQHIARLESNRVLPEVSGQRYRYEVIEVPSDAPA